MSPEQFSDYEIKRLINRRKMIPVLDALIEDPYAVDGGEELALHREILKECQRRGWAYVYHNPTKPTGATLGTPDFIIYADKGRVFNIECKTRTGKLSKEQINFRDKLIGLGHHFEVVRSMKRFMEVVA